MERYELPGIKPEPDREIKRLAATVAALDYKAAVLREYGAWVGDIANSAAWLAESIDRGDTPKYVRGGPPTLASKGQQLVAVLAEIDAIFDRELFVTTN